MQNERVSGQLAECERKTAPNGGRDNARTKKIGEIPWDNTDDGKRTRNVVEIETRLSSRFLRATVLQVRTVARASKHRWTLTAGRGTGRVGERKIFGRRKSKSDHRISELLVKRNQHKAEKVKTRSLYDVGRRTRSGPVADTATQPSPIGSPQCVQRPDRRYQLQVPVVAARRQQRRMVG